MTLIFVYQSSSPFTIIISVWFFWLIHDFFYMDIPLEWVMIEKVEQWRAHDTHTFMCWQCRVALQLTSYAGELHAQLLIVVHSDISHISPLWTRSTFILKKHVHYLLLQNFLWHPFNNVKGKTRRREGRRHPPHAICVRARYTFLTRFVCVCVFFFFISFLSVSTKIVCIYAQMDRVERIEGEMEHFRCTHSRPPKWRSLHMNFRPTVSSECLFWFENIYHSAILVIVENEKHKIVVAATAAMVIVGIVSSLSGQRWINEHRLWRYWLLFLWFSQFTVIVALAHLRVSFTLQRYNLIVTIANHFFWFDFWLNWFVFLIFGAAINIRVSGENESKRYQRTLIGCCLNCATLPWNDAILQLIVVNLWSFWATGQCAGETLSLLFTIQYDLGGPIDITVCNCNAMLNL